MIILLFISAIGIWVFALVAFFLSGKRWGWTPFKLATWTTLLLAACILLFGRPLWLLSPVTLDRAGKLCAVVESGKGSADYIFVRTAPCGQLEQRMGTFMVPECFDYAFSDRNKDGIKDLKLRKQFLKSLISLCENPEGTKSGDYRIDRDGKFRQ